MKCGSIRVYNLPLFTFVSTFQTKILNKCQHELSVGKKRSAPINFEFVRHSIALIVGKGIFVFSLVRFVASIYYVESKLETKNYQPDPWRKCDPKLIGAICYSVSSGIGERRKQKRYRSSEAIDYQFVSQKLFRNIFFKYTFSMKAIETLYGAWWGKNGRFYDVTGNFPIFHFGRITMAILTSIECRVMKYVSFRFFFFFHFFSPTILDTHTIG